MNMFNEKRIIAAVLLFLLASGALFAETVDVRPPVAWGETEEMQQRIFEAVKEGAASAGYTPGSSGGLRLSTWVRREQGFYQAKVELISGDDEYTAYERFDAADESALIAGLSAMAGQVAAEKTEADRAAAEEARRAEQERQAAEAARRAQELLDKRNMVLVDGGTFRMGSTDGDDDEKPVHSVTVSDFCISKYEVTQSLWKEVMGSNPSRFNGDNLPVEKVSWYEAVEFCNKLSVRDGLTPCYSGSGDSIRCDFSANGYRLPTEAEWEFAARGGNKSRGYVYAGGNSIGDVAWYRDNSGSKTHPVGQKPPNELGLYDMSGNVWEWCWDWYGSYSSGSRTDPAGPASGSDRVWRGGSWHDYARYCRPSVRDGIAPSSGRVRFIRLPSEQRNDHGFRLVHSSR